MNNMIGHSGAAAFIEDISWERIWLKVKIRVFSESKEAITDPKFYLVRDRHAAAEFMIDETDGDVYHIFLNITNQGEKRCLEAGKHALIVCVGDIMIARAEIMPELASRLPDYSRSFLYRAQKGMYTIAFFVSESDYGLPLQIHVIDDAVTVKGRKKSLRFQRVKKLMIIAYQVWSAFFRLICKNRKTLLFFSEQGESIGSNMAPLMARMRERGLDKEFRIKEFYCSVASRRVGPLIRIKEIYSLSRAHIIIIEDHVPSFDWLKLRDDTKLIMLWHAGAGYKGVGYSRWGHMGCPAPWCCHRQYTYAISASRNIASYFSEQFGINDSQVISTGMPRLDIYLDEKRREEVTARLFESFPMIQGKKVILFAPTYRGRDKKHAHYPYDLIDFEGLRRICADEYVVLFKMHPWVRKRVPIPDDCRDIMADVGTYPSINDLFYITDLYISDYSSGIFEYSLMRKPALFFAFDEAQFSLSRGFHRDYGTSVPGKVCRSFDDLLEAIERKDFAFEKMEPYLQKHFDYIDTGSCDRVIDWLLLDGIPEEYREQLTADELKNAARRALVFPPPILETKTKTRPSK